ncbi:MAG: Rieske (2Fe-2S) protein [Flavobacterium sp.]|nr:Rieske (2Fe-2S) protein [Pedobacter sp.]
MKSILPFLLISIAILSCNKDQEGRIPEVPVNFRAPLNDPKLTRLNSAGGVVVINGYGVAGIIIYRRPDNAYVAYDRCSSVNPEQICAVEPDDPSLTATDPCSGAKFSLYDGMPVKAPAKRPLKKYDVIITNFEISVIN